MRHLLHVWLHSDDPVPTLHSDFKHILRARCDSWKPEVWPATFVPPNVVDLVKHVQAFHPEARQVLFVGEAVHYFDAAGDAVALDMPLGDPRTEEIFRVQDNAAAVVRGLYPLPAAFIVPGLSADDRDLLRQTIENLETIEALRVESVGSTLLQNLKIQLQEALK